MAKSRNPPAVPEAQQHGNPSCQETSQTLGKLPFDIERLPNSEYFIIKESSNWDYNRLQSSIPPHTELEIKGRYCENGNWLIAPRNITEQRSEYIYVNPLLRNGEYEAVKGHKVKANQSHRKPTALPHTFAKDVSVLDVSSSIESLLKKVNSKTENIQSLAYESQDNIWSSPEFMEFEQEVLATFSRRYPDATLVKDWPILRVQNTNHAAAISQVHTDIGNPHFGLKHLLKKGWPINNFSRNRRSINFKQELGPTRHKRLLQLADHKNSKVLPISIWIFLGGNEETTLNFFTPKEKYLQANVHQGYIHDMEPNAPMWSLQNQKGLAVAFDTSRIPHFASKNTNQTGLRMSAEIRCYAVWDEQKNHAAIWP